MARTADAGAITKAYRKLAKKKHPDKGGDPEEFKALAEAYEVRVYFVSAFFCDFVMLQSMPLSRRGVSEA